MTTTTASPRTQPRLLARAHARVRLSIGRVPRPLGLILIVAALQSVAWDIAVPPFQGPDESSHFAYVQHLAETGNTPSVTAGSSENSREAQAALSTLNLESLEGNLGAQPAWSAIDLDLWRQVERGLPHGSRSNGSGPNPLAKNPPLYYAAMAIPYRMLVWLPLLKRLFVLRLFNALFYLATVALVWMIAGEVFAGTRWKQTLAAGVVALQPQLAFMSAVINADTLLVTLMTAVLWASVRLVQRGPSLGRALAAGTLTGATILTHGRGLVAVPVLATALVASAISHRVALGQAAKQTATAAGAVAAAFAAYLLFGRSSGGGLSGGIYGGQVSELNSGPSFGVRQFISSIYQFYFTRLSGQRPRIGPEYGYRQVFITSFYGAFGSLEVMFAKRVYDALQIFSAVGLVGLYTAVVTRWRRLRQSWDLVLVLLSLLVTTVFFLHYVSYRALLSNSGRDPLIVGRYLLPMVALFGLAITFAVGALPQRIGRLTAAAILTVGVLLSLGGVGITMARFYG